MDAIEMLEKQHREVATLFARYEKADGSVAKMRLFEQIADNLAVHASIEEIHFYPAVRARRTKDILFESLEEHLGIKRVLADILEIDADDETFAAKMKVLQEQVEHHVAEEEHDLFPKVKQLLDGKTLEGIGRAMAVTALQLMEDGEPRYTIPDETSSPAGL